MNSEQWGRLRELARNVRAGRHETDAKLAQEAAAELSGLVETIASLESDNERLRLEASCK